LNELGDLFRQLGFDLRGERFAIQNFAGQGITFSRDDKRGPN
jgi:hypothetical protein